MEEVQQIAAIDLAPLRIIGAGLVVIGAGIGNAVSDFTGGLASGNIVLAIGTGLGCLIALVTIPLLYKLQKYLSK